MSASCQQPAFCRRGGATSWTSAASRQSTEPSAILIRDVGVGVFAGVAGTHAVGGRRARQPIQPIFLFRKTAICRTVASSQASNLDPKASEQLSAGAYVETFRGKTAFGIYLIRADNKVIAHYRQVQSSMAIQP